jgi:hypothetical protein
VKEVLEPWDITVTEKLIATWKQMQEQKLAKAAREQADRLQVLFASYCVSPGIFHRK